VSKGCIRARRLFLLLVRQFILLLNDNLGSSDSSGSTGSDQTDLLSWWRIATASRRVTNVLVITTSVRMVHRIHGHTTHAWPAVALHLVLVEGTASLQHRLLDTASARDDAHHTTARSGHSFLLARWELELRALVSVAQHGGEAARRTRQRSTISVPLLHVAQDSTLRHRANRQHVTNSQGSFLSAVNKLTSVQALRSNKQLVVKSVLIRISKDNLG